MRRDMDLVRRILQAVESSDGDPREYVELDFVAEYPKNSVSYHVELLADAGLIKAQNLMSFGEDGYSWMPKRLTSAGHDFLDAARHEENWNEAKRLLKRAGVAGLTLLKDQLIHLAKQRLGLPG